MTEERWLPALPYGLLALAAAVAVMARPMFGDAAADLPVTLAVMAVTALWMALVPRPTAVHYTGRTVLAFVLCWLNPLFAIFACIGFVDAYDSLRARWVYVGIAAVAVTQAGAQSGGLPPDGIEQGVLLVALVLLNGGLAALFLRSSERIEERSDELARLNTDLHRALAENDALHRQLVEQARTAGVQDERGRLAREIHDTIAQDLAGIVTQLEAGVGGERHERVLRLAREALADTRRSVLDLAPSDLDDADLPAALGAVVHGWGADRPARVDVVVVGDPVPLHPEVEATVLRVTQESLTNVAKHAGAPGRVGVTLSYDDEEVVLDVRDDGDGFDPATPVATNSFGLRGMRQRAERLAGTLTVESRPGYGTAVSMRLPDLSRDTA
jgi:signal transduction histidine kinase